jgi:hypothetical protein
MSLYSWHDFIGVCVITCMPWHILKTGLCRGIVETDATYGSLEEVEGNDDIGSPG